MSRESIEQALRHGRALRRSASQAVGPGAGDRPEPGDLWVLPNLGDVPELWAVAEVDLPERVRLVPADLNPMLGIGDVVVPAHSRCGALALRTRHATWVDTDRLIAGLRAQCLEEEDLEKLRGRLDGFGEREQRGTWAERKVEDDSEYLALNAELRRICESLDVGHSRSPLPFGAGATRHRTWLLAAASVLLAVGLGGLWTTVLDPEPGAGSGSEAPVEDPVDLRKFRLRFEETQRSQQSAPEIIPADLERFVLLLAMPPGYDPGEYELRLVFQNETVHREVMAVDDGAEIQWSLSRAQLSAGADGRPSAGTYRVEVRKTGDSVEPPVLFEVMIAAP